MDRTGSFTSYLMNVVCELIDAHCEDVKRKAEDRSSSFATRNMCVAEKSSQVSTKPQEDVFSAQALKIFSRYLLTTAEQDGSLSADDEMVLVRIISLLGTCAEKADTSVSSPFEYLHPVYNALHSKAGQSAGCSNVALSLMDGMHLLQWLAEVLHGSSSEQLEAPNRARCVASCTALIASDSVSPFDAAMLLKVMPVSIMASSVSHAERETANVAVQVICEALQRAVTVLKHVESSGSDEPSASTTGSSTSDERRCKRSREADFDLTDKKTVSTGPSLPPLRTQKEHATDEPFSLQEQILAVKEFFARKDASVSSPAPAKAFDPQHPQRVVGGTSSSVVSRLRGWMKGIASDCCTATGVARHGFTLDTKYDGERLLGHYVPDESSNTFKWHFFSRNRLVVPTRKLTGVEEVLNAAFVACTRADEAPPVSSMRSDLPSFFYRRGVVFDAEILSSSTFGSMNEVSKAKVAEHGPHIYLFDVLWAGGFDLCGCPLWLRRAVLRCLVQPEVLTGMLTPHGWIRLAESVIVDSALNDTEAVDKVRLTLQHHLARHLEGLVAKPLASVYRFGGTDWVKLKKGYLVDQDDAPKTKVAVEGYLPSRSVAIFDTLDLLVIGTRQDPSLDAGAVWFLLACRDVTAGAPLRAVGWAICRSSIKLGVSLDRFRPLEALPQYKIGENNIMVSSYVAIPADFCLQGSDGSPISLLQSVAEAFIVEVKVSRLERETDAGVADQPWCDGIFFGLRSYPGEEPCTVVRIREDKSLSDVTTKQFIHNIYDCEKSRRTLRATKKIPPSIQLPAHSSPSSLSSSSNSCDPKLPKCPYWDKCVRKNPAHFKEFAHPC